MDKIDKKSKFDGTLAVSLILATAFIGWAAYDSKDNLYHTASDAQTRITELKSLTVQDRDNYRKLNEILVETLKIKPKDVTIKSVESLDRMKEATCVLLVNENDQQITFWAKGDCAKPVINFVEWKASEKSFKLDFFTAKAQKTIQNFMVEKHAASVQQQVENAKMARSNALKFFVETVNVQ